MPSDDYEGIVVLGTPRSGTTLVRRLLNAHPRIACPPETNLLNAVARAIREERFAEGMTVGMVSGLAFSGYDESTVLERVREFVFQFFREICARSGKPRWAEKTAADAFYVDEIERVCGPRCRYVCVYRHGLDVVCSMKELTDKMQMYLPELHRYVRDVNAPFEAFARAWADVTARLQRFASDHPDWCVSVRYEDLVEDPARELHRVLEFLGEPADLEALLGGAMGGQVAVGLGDWKTYTMRSIEGANIGRWRRELSRATSSGLALIVNPALASLGYDSVDVRAEVSPDAARHHYQVSWTVARMSSSRSAAREVPP